MEKRMSKITGAKMAEGKDVHSLATNKGVKLKPKPFKKSVEQKKKAWIGSSDGVMKR